MKNTKTTWTSYKYRCKGSRKQNKRLKLKLYSLIIIAIALALGVTYTSHWYDGIIGDIERTADFNIKVAKAAKLEESAVQSPEEIIRQIAQEHNFQWPDYLIRLADCESKLNQFALNNNGIHGIDRGIFQINDRYQPQISNECAFDIRCATEFTMEKINQGFQELWMCNDIILNK